jgi:hypothetical protein
MPRANRHYIPGYVWHITHRCHKKDFLLKFARDRRRWLRWLFEALTESVAVGSRSFVDTTREKLGIKVRGREVIEKNGSCELRESPEPYRAILGDENNSIRLQNAYFLNDNV